jgi:hypothetical protein
VRPIRITRVLGASALGLGVIAGVCLWVAAKDPVTRPRFLSILDRLHIIGPRKTFWREAQALAKQDAAADARKAFDAGDQRLLGMTSSKGPYLRGTNSLRYQSLLARFGVRFLWTGGILSSEEEWQLRVTQEEYAARYNREILRLAGADEHSVNP